MDNPFEVTALHMKNQETLISFGCPLINKIFKGGIDCCGITQFYGEAGTGKTQFALQLCLAVQLPITDGGLGAGAIYICTEAAFPIRRLQQLLESSEMSKKYNLNGDTIFVEHVSTMEELELCLCKKIPLLMAARKIGLIVLDSVTAPYRVEDWDDQEKKRTKSLRIIGRQLHKLSSDNVCVICLNQVTAVIGFNHQIHQQNFQPCLGITWSSMVTTSICLYKIGAIRQACVILSPRVPSTSFSFAINQSGLMGMD